MLILYAYFLSSFLFWFIFLPYSNIESFILISFIYQQQHSCEMYECHIDMNNKIKSVPTTNKETDGLLFRSFLFMQYETCGINKICEKWIEGGKKQKRFSAKQSEYQITPTIQIRINHVYCDFSAGDVLVVKIVCGEVRTHASLR